MASSVFTTLVRQAVETARAGTLLSESLFQETLNEVPTSSDEVDRESIALAIRQLVDFFDSWDFRWAERRLSEGASLDDLHLEPTEREVFFQAPTNSEERKLIESFGEIKRDTDFRLQAIRDFETLMGFDQDVTNTVITTLGEWDDSASPHHLFDLLPDEIRFSAPRYKARWAI